MPSGSVSQVMDQYAVMEDEGSVEVCWILSPANITFERSVEFLASTELGSAMDADYSSLSNVTVSPTERNNLCAVVQINTDSIIEDTEEFTVELTSLDSAIHFVPNSSLIQVS